MIQRRTLRTSVVVDGRGLHSGVPVRVSIHPGEHGIRFRRENYIVEAMPENVADTNRCTKLGEISTIEHLMSALAGCEITDAEIEVTANELPGLDGSSSLYVQALSEAGVELFGERELPDLFTRVFLQEEQIKIAVSKGSGHWSYKYVTGDRWPGEQAYDCRDVVGTYATDIAPARTIALSEEVPLAIATGLGQGLTEKDVLILGTHGYENEARFVDEPARHKLLDLIGDLYLAGVPISRLNVSAERSGHRTNVAVAMMLKRALTGQPE